MGADRGGPAKTVGAMFEAERGRRNMSQARAAERLGVSQQWVSRLERGAVSPSTATLDRMFGIFGLQVRLDLEPAGADLDAEIDECRSLDEVEHATRHLQFGRSFNRLRTVPYVLSGRYGAFAQVRALGR